jgi:hypothetical protein
MAQVVNARLQTRSLFATSSPQIHWVVVLIGAWARAATERALDRILSALLKPPRVANFATHRFETRSNDRSVTASDRYPQ